MGSFFTIEQRRQMRQLKQSMATIAKLEQEKHDPRHWTIAAAHARAALGLIELAIPHLIDRAPAAPEPPHEVTLPDGTTAIEYTEIIEGDEIEYTRADQAIVDLVRSLHQQIVVLVAGLVAVAADIEAKAIAEAEIAEAKIHAQLIDVDEVSLMKSGDIEEGFSTHSAD